MVTWGNLQHTTYLKGKLKQSRFFIIDAESECIMVCIIISDIFCISYCFIDLSCNYCSFITVSAIFISGPGWLEN